MFCVDRSHLAFFLSSAHKYLQALRHIKRNAAINVSEINDIHHSSITYYLLSALLKLFTSLTKTLRSIICPQMFWSILNLIKKNWGNNTKDLVLHWIWTWTIYYNVEGRSIKRWRRMMIHDIFFIGVAALIMKGLVFYFMILNFYHWWKIFYLQL